MAENKKETAKTPAKPGALEVIQKALKAAGISATTLVTNGVRGKVIAVVVDPDKEK